MHLSIEKSAVPGSQNSTGLVRQCGNEQPSDEHQDPINAQPHESLFIGNLQERGDSRIDPAYNDEPLDDVTSLEALFHGSTVGSVRQGRG